MKLTSISASRYKTYDTCTFKYLMTYHLYKCSECGQTFYDKEFVNNVKQCIYCKCEKISKIPMKTNWGAMHGTALHWVLENYGNAIRGMFQDGTPLTLQQKRFFLNWKKRVEDIYKVGPAFQDNIQYELLSLAKQKDYQDIEKDCDKCPFFKKKECSITAKNVDSMNGCPKLLFNTSIKLVEKVLTDMVDVFNNAKILGTEQVFEIELGKGKNDEILKCNGVIDLVAQTSEDTIELYDYKFGNWTQTYDEVSNDIQAKIYSIAAKRLYPGYKNYILNFQYVKGNPIILSFSNEEDEKTLQLVVQQCNSIIEVDQGISRIANNPLTFWKCKNLCDPTLCNEEWSKFTKKFGK